MSMETNSGVIFDIADPKPELVYVGDIATHLAGINRYTGATGRTYSVAEHSCMAHDCFLGDRGITDPFDDRFAIPQETADIALAILLHDAHEAYTGDLSKPLLASSEKLKVAYKELANPVQLAILTMAGLSHEFLEHPIVKRYDNGTLLVEAEAMMKSKGHGWIDTWSIKGNVATLRVKPQCWDINTARWAFVYRYARYRPVDYRVLLQCNGNAAALFNFHTAGRA